MDIVKKILIVTLLVDSSAFLVGQNSNGCNKKTKKQVIECTFEQQSSQSSSAKWAGIAGAVGLVAGTALGYWLSELDCNQPQTTIEPYVVYETNVYEVQQESGKSRQIRSQLNELAKYGQYFDVSDHEQAVISTLNKLGFSLGNIDSDFYHTLNADYKILHDAGYSIWWHNLKNLEDQKNLYLSNSKKIISFFYRHGDFIKTCQIINSYNDMLAYRYNLDSWVALQCRSRILYPVLNYAEKVETDVQQLHRLQRNFLYPALAQKVQTLTAALDYLLEFIYQSDQYRHEVAQKRQDELMAEYHRIEQEKLEIARRQAELQEQANSIARERNRIEQDKFFRCQK
ncbi:hypothetical protein KBC04_00620 [Candidatus Babeliales bacterium]|nr:hypothetical protein [Candidatus Babeliales bacterium]MBP9843405.1 hypothetical protein [Candidatus Babeliales bacterium]